MGPRPAKSRLPARAFFYTENRGTKVKAENEKDKKAFLGQLRIVFICQLSSVNY
jgi:hypothetical protein